MELVGSGDPQRALVSGREVVEIGPVYAKPEMADMLRGGWRRALEALLDCALTCNHLDAEQLVKHALAMQSQFPGDDRTLAYVYWKPANADELQEVAGHANELQHLVEVLGDDVDPTFEVLSYDELFAGWDAIESPSVTKHLAALRARYADVTV